MFLIRKRNKRNLQQVHRYQLLCRMLLKIYVCTIQAGGHNKTNNNNKPYCEGNFPQTPFPFTLKHRKITKHTYTQCPQFRDKIEKPQNRIKVHNTITKMQLVLAAHSIYFKSHNFYGTCLMKIG